MKDRGMSWKSIPKKAEDRQKWHYYMDYMSPNYKHLRYCTEDEQPAQTFVRDRVLSLLPLHSYKIHITFNCTAGVIIFLD